VLAIAGLLAGSVYGWIWMDPLMGLVGALVIARWSWGLMRDAGAVLVDAVPDRGLAEAIRTRIEVDGDRISDLHLWRASDPATMRPSWRLSPIARSHRPITGRGSRPCPACRMSRSRSSPALATMPRIDEP
jgi:hypothetical protein